MHGLNTIQKVDFTPFVAQNQDTLQPLRSFIMEEALDNPSGLQYILNGFVPTSDIEYYIKRLYKQLFMVNNSVFPVICTAYFIKIRHDTVANMTAMMSEDAPPINYPYFSLTTSPEFRKQAKVIKSKRFTMMPGKPYKFTIKSSYAGRKPIIGAVEGDGAHYNYRKGNTTLMLKFDGIPQPSNATGVYGNTLSSVIINGIARWFVSYYRMDDAEVNSTGSTTLPSTNPGSDNYILCPTTFNAMAQNTPTLSSYYVPPMPVTTTYP